MTGLLELAARVEAAEGPDRELDCEIWLAVTDGASRSQWSYIHKGSGRECFVDETRDASRRLIIVPAYTTSLDAAMTLVPEGCLHMARTLWDEGNTAGNAVVHRYRFEGDAIVWTSDHSAVAATPALALTAAALKARALSLM